MDLTGLTWFGQITMLHDIAFVNIGQDQPELGRGQEFPKNSNN